jgi:Zn-dependent peptidase ImmA (M78 family)
MGTRRRYGFPKNRREKRMKDEGRTLASEIQCLVYTSATHPVSQRNFAVGRPMSGELGHIFLHRSEIVKREVKSLVSPMHMAVSAPRKKDGQGDFGDEDRKDAERQSPK